MLLFKDARRERFFSVVFVNRNDALGNDGAAIQSFIDKVNGATGEFHAVFDSL